jgi:hypothetical protein
LKREHRQQLALSLEAQRELCLAQDSPDAARAAQCDESTVKLFPSGLSIVNASLLAESGNTARVAHLIKEEEPAIEDQAETEGGGEGGGE